MGNKTIFKTKAKDPTSAILGISPDSTNITIPISGGPHFLVAGTTGSGKSVFINSLLITMMSHSHPDELKLTIIDPKTVEFTAYKDLPYMLCNPVTDMSKANNLVLYLVEEMERRYDLLAENGVKNLAEYQEKQREDDKLEKLPYIVLVVDEFADLISQYKEVEKPIARIGQKARAAGIHMIIATQSPRREVITGLIKANVPSRVSLMVANSTESQIILDETGGEQLRPRGDFLLKMNGGQVTRGQAPFVSNEEIDDIFAHMRETYGKPEVVDFESKLQEMLEAKGQKPGGETAKDSASKYHGSGMTRKGERGSRRNRGTDISSNAKEQQQRVREKLDQNEKEKKKKPIKRTVDGSRFVNKKAREQKRKEKGINNKSPGKAKMTSSKTHQVESQPVTSQEPKSQPSHQSKQDKAPMTKTRQTATPASNQKSMSTKSTSDRPGTSASKLRPNVTQSPRRPQRSNNLMQGLPPKGQPSQRPQRPKRPSGRPQTSQRRPQRTVR